MKRRNIIAVFSALACLGLLPITQAAPAPETPDPASTCGLCTADGTSALASASGSANSAFGWSALRFNADASFNTAVGAGALLFNNGSPNTAVGAAALLFNTTGGNNVAVGAAALLNNTESTDNTIVGAFAGQNVVTLGGNIYIGSGVNGPADEIAFIRIGQPSILGGVPYDTYISGIFDRAIDAGTAQFVFVDDQQKVGTILVNADGNTVPFKPQAMLDESLKQQKRIAELEGMVTQLAATVKEQAAQIQKVSAQLEVIKPAPQVVANKR